MEQVEHKWLYYKLYVGQYYKQLDYLVTEATAEISEHDHVLTWFFIRYFDEGGMHLRLRIKVDAEHAKALDMLFYRKLHDFCSTLLEQPEPSYSPLVSLPEQEDPAGSFPALVVTKREQYKPEFDIYGENIEAAETLFWHSSEIARDIINIEKSHNDLSRKDIVTRLMFEGIRAFKPSETESVFLESFANYWLAGSTELGNYKNTFEDKAYDLIDDGISVIKPLSAYPVEFESILIRWKDSLNACYEQYKKYSFFNAALSDRVLFYFIHLMNNRIGLTPLDEAYVATLLKTALQREGIHEVA